jgi:hypothetical protein
MEENWRTVQTKKNNTSRQPINPPVNPPANSHNNSSPTGSPTPYHRSNNSNNNSRENTPYTPKKNYSNNNSRENTPYIPKKNNSNNNSPKGKRKPYVVIADYSSSEEELMYKEMIKEFPHIKIPGQIRRMAASMNIDSFADKMLSDEWIEFQKAGWEFVKVVKPDDDAPLPETDDYELMSLENKWGDYILFKKI